MDGMPPKTPPVTPVPLVARPGLGPAGWYLLSGILFSLMLACFKWVGQTLPVPQLLLLRQLALLLVLIPIIASTRGACLRPANLGLNLVRGLASAGAMIAGFIAVVNLPLAEATTLNFTKAIFVVLLGSLLLREGVTMPRLGAVALGFVGVLVIARPDAGGFLDDMALLAVLAAFLAAVSLIIVRKLSAVETPATMMAYQSGIVLVIFLIPGLSGWVTPSLDEWAVIAVTGLLMWGAQWTMIRAHQGAEASALSSIEYLRLIHASILGVILFGEWPTVATAIGAVLIIAAALWVQRAEARR